MTELSFYQFLLKFVQLFFTFFSNLLIAYVLFSWIQPFLKPVYKLLHLFFLPFRRVFQKCRWGYVDLSVIALFLTAELIRVSLIYLLKNLIEKTI